MPYAKRETDALKSFLWHLTGGIDLAAEWAGFETVGQCEWADYPTKVLEKHWPDVPRWRDIRTLTGESFYERTGRKTVDLVSGGFPCQPHSVAGLRQGSDDERDLSGEFIRVVREIKPAWVLGENVSGLLTSEDGRFFGGFIRDLAELGYCVGWSSVRASWVGAIHRRERIFIVAHSNEIGLQRRLSEEKQQETNEQSERVYLHLLRHADKEYLSKSSIFRKSDGVPDRVDRSKCLGNTVVPQQVYPILKAIAELEAGKSGKDRI